MKELEKTSGKRKEQLKNVVETYFESLKNKTFETIPFSEDAEFRAPLTPGGVHVPVKGKQAIFEQWWKPLEPALEGVGIKIIDHYYNDSLTGVITKADVTLAGPGITLRVADRFVINEEGLITEQENHFDASPLRG